ncbi:uncharacterized protein LOC111446536 [Cucurbita moschata]|uniref:Uncharacterized protein LOC111446536 n=1 Tax=Cucurbita moschata TaxID=3662 RepID=A0A6J1FKB8_CUCMO|nr:uncharacterized protein LOC111446536 [Cucurbita moschata]XP_022941151.1 uncharacterized protein LOC111446536 [Cucurbita moschata]
MRSDDCDWRKDNKCSSVDGRFQAPNWRTCKMFSIGEGTNIREHTIAGQVRIQGHRFQQFHQDGWYWRACDNITTLFYLRSGQTAFRTEAKQNHTDQNQEIKGVMGNWNALTLCHDS